VNGSITGKLNFSAVYAVCNKDGRQIGEITGLELAEYYNGKSRHMNKDTKIVYSNTNALEHIELYNAEAFNIKPGKAESLARTIGKQANPSNTEKGGSLSELMIHAAEKVKATKGVQSVDISADNRSDGDR